VVVRHLFACVYGADGRSVMNRYPWRLLVVALVTDGLPGYEDRGEEQEHR
jgi:hypothetical protein